ncbi:unnamed protein product, partial [Closterium sp. NIES-54]
PILLPLHHRQPIGLHRFSHIALLGQHVHPSHASVDVHRPPHCQHPRAMIFEAPNSRLTSRHPLPCHHSYAMLVPHLPSDTFHLLSVLLFPPPSPLLTAPFVPSPPPPPPFLPPHLPSAHLPSSRPPAHEQPWHTA